MGFSVFSLLFKPVFSQFILHDTPFCFWLLKAQIKDARTGGIDDLASLYLASRS